MTTVTAAELKAIRARSDAWASQRRGPHGAHSVRDLRPSNAARAAFDRMRLLELFDEASMLAERLDRKLARFAHGGRQLLLDDEDGS